MLYELVGIVRAGNLAEVKEIALTCGQVVLRQGGVIRSLQNLGVFSLPRPVTKHQMKHRTGHYFVMRYDSSAAVHKDVRSTMMLDPRVVRAGHVKLGDGTLQSIAKYRAEPWNSQEPVTRRV